MAWLYRITDVSHLDADGTDLRPQGKVRIVVDFGESGEPPTIHATHNFYAPAEEDVATIRGRIEEFGARFRATGERAAELAAFEGVILPLPNGG